MNQCNNVFESSLKTNSEILFISFYKYYLFTSFYKYYFFMPDIAFGAGDNSPRTLQYGGIKVF